MNRREMLAAAAGAVGCAALPAVEASTTTTSYSAPFWQFSDVEKAERIVTWESRQRGTERARQYGLIIKGSHRWVKVSRKQWIDYLVWASFEAHSLNPDENNQLFTDIRDVPYASQVRFLEGSSV